MPTALFVSAGGVAPSVSEVTADEPDDDRARALTRRMRELDKPRLAKCDQRGGDSGRACERIDDSSSAIVHGFFRA